MVAIHESTSGEGEVEVMDVDGPRPSTDTLSRWLDVDDSVFSVIIDASKVEVEVCELVREV